MTKPSPLRTGDRGFTIVELMIAVVTVSIVVSVLASLFTITLRNNPYIVERTDEARILQGVVTFLPQDVDSTPPTGFSTDPETPSGCADSPGTSLLHLQWTEMVSGVTTTYVANYRHFTSGGVSTIYRVSCRGTGAKPLPNTVVASASGAVPPLPTGWQQGELPAAVEIFRESPADPLSDVTLVVFEVESLEGVVLRVDSAPKNPAHTLPPTTVTDGAGISPGTTVPATTTTIDFTSTTVVGSTTTLAPTTTLPGCVVVSSSAPASMFNTDPNGNGTSPTTVGVLRDSLTITVTTNGWCSGLEARPLTGAPNGELFRNFTTTDGVTYRVSFPGYLQGSSELWADGLRLIRFYTPLDSQTSVGSVSVTIR